MRASLVSAMALALLAAPLAAPASAGQSSPARHLSSQPGHVPTLSTALSTALSIGGVGQGDTGKPLQITSAPTVQAAVGVAVAVDGNSSAVASNTGAGGPR